MIYEKNCYCFFKFHESQQKQHCSLTETALLQNDLQCIESIQIDLKLFKAWPDQTLLIAFFIFFGSVAFQKKYRLQTSELINYLGVYKLTLHRGVFKLLFG